MYRSMFLCVVVLCALCTGCNQISKPQIGKNDVYRGQALDEGSAAVRKDSLSDGGTVLITETGVPRKLVFAGPTPFHDKPRGTMSGRESDLFDIVFTKEIKEYNGEHWEKVSFSKASGSELGWILLNEENAFPWLHGIALRLCRMGTHMSRLHIYETFDDCSGAIAGKDVSPIGEIDLPKLEEKLFARNPWPILARRDFSTDGHQYTAYQVLMLAQKGKTGATSKSSAGKYSQRELNTIRAEIRTCDVLVLIDNTESMDKWMNSTKDAVKNFTHAFKQDGIDARFQLATFRDVDDGNDLFRIYPPESVQDFCRRLDGLSADGGGDEPEAGYNAMQQLLTRATFRSRSERILLVVADSPWHTSGRSNPNRINNSDVIALAKRNNVKVDILAVADGSGLAKQVSPISQQTGGKTFTLNTTYALINEIASILKKEAKGVSDQASVLDELIRGKTNDEIAVTLKKSPNEITNLVRLLRDVKGINLDKLAAGEAVMLTGWVIPFAPNLSAGTLEVFLSRTEAEEILKVLQEILRASPDTTIGPRIWTAAQNERIRSEPLGYYFKENCLPFRSTSILSYSLEEIQRLPENVRARIQDEVYPLIRRLDAEIKEAARWIRRDDGRIMGWISESCLP